MSGILKFCKSQPVLTVAFVAAMITVCIVHPDAGYLTYCNHTVLIQLFCLMTAVAGFRSTGLFEKITDVLLRRAGNLRRLGMIFTFACFFTSMLVTNDVALLTFVPLTLILYNRIPNENCRIYTIVLETAAANLGSMATPFGNPQNLYIYEKYGMTAWDFFRIMFPSVILSLIILILLCLFLPMTECAAQDFASKSVSKGYFSAYFILFVICLLTVFHIIPDIVCLIVTVSAAVLLDRRLLLKVDYTLLATFVCFFVFVGNISRIESISSFFSKILTGRELIVSILLSQGISNVPAAVMLSGFTDNGNSLLLGVNLGGLGTIIASLASLISFQFYRKSENARSGKYLLVFTAVNVGILSLLLPLALIGLI